MTMREEFEAWYESLPPANYDAFHAWQAAYRVGQAEMRERAAITCQNYPAEFGFKPRVAAAIRALPLDSALDAAKEKGA